MKNLRLGILGSTRGTDMLALIAAIEKEELHASIEVVISNKQNAVILERAQSFGIKNYFIDPTNLSREDFDNLISQQLIQHHVDLIVLIGYMRILSKEFVNQWRHKIINVHPSLLPAFAGGMNNDVHQAVLNSGALETGCTVHYVIEDLDAGPILMQKRCVVSPHETVETLKTKVQKLEGEALIEVINNLFFQDSQHPTSPIEKGGLREILKETRS